MEVFDKSQTVRKLDVVFVGPFIILSAFIIGISSPWGIVLFIIGMLTILYNLQNYLGNR